MPGIAHRLLADNDFPPVVVERITALIEEIPAGQIRPLTDTEVPDAADWFGYVAPYLGQDWLQVPWFFAETYFYRRILEATAYFLPGPSLGKDPFAYQKRRGLETSQEAIAGLALQVGQFIRQPDHLDRALARLLNVDLWGNQADLSMWPAGTGQKPDHQDSDQQQAHVLVDDTTAVVEHLLRAPAGESLVIFLIDNAGFELVADLSLAAFLLHHDLAATVRLHLKSHPTFVSDALAADVQQTVTYLAESGHRPTAVLAGTLQAFLAAGRLQLAQDWFWTSPLALWQMPAALNRELAPAHLLISKGDANYRRLLGDRHWPHVTPFGDIVCYAPAPLLALRTLKSEVAVGLMPGQQQDVANRDPDWLVNGRWGVIQFWRGD